MWQLLAEELVVWRHFKKREPAMDCHGRFCDANWKKLVGGDRVAFQDVAHD